VFQVLCIIVAKQRFNSLLLRLPIKDLNLISEFFFFIDLRRAKPDTYVLPSAIVEFNLLVTI